MNIDQIREQADVEITKKLVLSSFANFVEYFFKIRYGFSFVWNWHHLVMADYVDKVVNGEITYLVINLPPRYTKTEFWSIFFPAYGFAKNAQSKFITTSYSQSLTLLNSSRVQEIINLPEFQRLFPSTS
ncbi:MAG: hypothetical protein HC908_03795 [Calothrix sp. SM1_7_51]|nr:hypothetical protein [Calothrix sp. SM1_7_51]